MKHSYRAALISISIMWLAAAASAQTKAPVRVTVDRLVANPESYDGKLVEVSGFLVLAGAETGGRLFADRQDFENGVLAASVRVERTEQMEANRDQLDGRNVSITGIFRQGEAQKKGTGLVHEIIACRLVGAPPGERVRPGEQAAIEAAVVRDLRTLNTACVSYAVAYAIGYPQALGNLGPSKLLDRNGAGLVDRSLASGSKDGYQFTYSPGAIAAGRVPSYALHADPLGAATPGMRHFFTDQTGIIRVNASARARLTDPPIESAGQMPGGVAGGISSGADHATPPPAPPPTRTANSARIGVGEVEQAGKLIYKVEPIYPPLARQAKIQGTVRMRAVIAKDGTVQDLEVVSGPPLLVRSAIDAAKFWRYLPTEVGGQAVEVETFIKVTFSLSGNP